MIDVTVSVQVNERPMKGTPCEGVHCGCQKATAGLGVMSAGATQTVD